MIDFSLFLRATLHLYGAGRLPYAVLIAIAYLPALMLFWALELAHSWRGNTNITLLNLQKEAAAPPSTRLTVTTANLCLLPSFAARFSQLADTPTRAVAIGSIYAKSNAVIDENRSVVTASMVASDVLCLQEVFDAEAAAALVRQMQPRFPHVAMDAWQRIPGICYQYD